MTLQPNDLILEVIGTPTSPLNIPNAVKIDVWSDARIGDATLHIRLEHAKFAAAALEYIKAQGLTPIGARVIETQKVVTTPAQPKARSSFLSAFRPARAA